MTMNVISRHCNIEKNYLKKHLAIAKNFYTFWYIGSLITKSLSKKKNEYRDFLKFINSFSRFINLRSAMEGLLFEQICDVPFKIKQKGIGISDQYLLINVYFSTHNIDLSKEEWYINNLDNINNLIETYLYKLFIFLSDLKLFIITSSRGIKASWKSNGLRNVNKLIDNISNII